MDGLSAEEMRNALYERLHNKGLLDLLKVTKYFMVLIILLCCVQPVIDH